MPNIISPIRVLQVEDNPSDAEYVRESLCGGDATEFRVEVVTRLSAARERLLRGGVDVVLLDLGLPDSQGIETFLRLKEGKVSDTAIIVLTGLQDDAIGALVLQNGAQDFLNKQHITNTAALQRCIRHAHERKRYEAAEQQRTAAARRDRYHRDVLEMLAKGEPLPETLEAIVAFVERELPDSICSILVLDETGRHLLLGAAPHFPDFYNAAVHGIEIGPTVGSCGAAAFTACRVIAEDIETHPNWLPYRDLTRRTGLRSCWSEPIFSSAGRVSGTFAVYRAAPHSPSADEVELVAIAAHLASIAIERQQADKALRDSEERFRLLVDGVKDYAIFMLDTDGNVVSWNVGAERITGWTMVEILGRPVSCIYTPADVANGKLEQELEIARAYGNHRSEGERIRKDGTHFLADASTTAMRDGQGRLRGFAKVTRDISRRRRDEEALRQSEERLRLAAEASGFGTYDRDLLTGTRIWSAKAKTIFGFAPDEPITDETIREHLHSDDRTMVLEAQRASFDPNGRGGFALEHRVVHPDGSTRWVQVLGKTYFEGEADRRRAVRAIGVAMDITDRKLVEMKLLESEERLSFALDTSQIGAWELDLIDHSAYRTLTHDRIFGYRELLSDWTYEMFLEHVLPEDRAEVERRFQDATGTQSDWNFECRIRRVDNEVRWIWAAGRHLRKENDVVRSMAGIVQDITERKRAEEEQRRLESQLQHAQKLESLGVLAGGIAHDFNNLLTGILGYSDLALLELASSSPARQLIGEAINGARRAAELTKQMLAYSGKGRFVVESLNLSTVTEDMVRLLQISISKKCVMKFNLMPDLPLVEADAVQVRQIIMNLIINASEAIGDRSGVIVASTGVMHCDRAYLVETYLDDSLPEGLYAYLEVADNGCGMSEETRARIFDPFFTTKFTGRGLGLSAVLGIVRGHRGAMKCYSELGKGTTFKVLLPVTTVPAIANEKREGEPAEWRGHGSVLIVDDEESVRGLARHMLQKMGFTVMLAADGREGVEVFRRESERIRLVLLDLTMPHLDGEECFRELRRIRGNVLAILTSGYNEQTATSRFAGKGLAAFIQKPFRFEDLMAVVRRALGSEADGNTV